MDDLHYQATTYKVAVAENLNQVRSIIVTISKLMGETKLQEHLDRNKVLPIRQNRFERFHSINIALLHICSVAATAIDASCCKSDVLIDCGKTFNILNHELLVAKLNIFWRL